MAVGNVKILILTDFAVHTMGFHSSRMWATTFFCLINNSLSGCSDLGPLYCKMNRLRTLVRLLFGSICVPDFSAHSLRNFLRHAFENFRSCSGPGRDALASFLNMHWKDIRHVAIENFIELHVGRFSSLHSTQRKA